LISVCTLHASMDSDFCAAVSLVATGACGLQP